MLSVTRSVLYLGMLCVCAVLGGRLLIVIAPWRQYEILAVTLFAVVAGVVGWAFAPQIRGARSSLLASVGITAIALGVVHYQRFMVRYPPLASYEVAAVSNEVERAALPKTGSGFCKAGTRPMVLAEHQVPGHEVLRQANRILQSEYQFVAYPFTAIDEDPDWTERAFGDRSWNWHLHVMQYVATLTRAYELTGDRIFLARAETLVLDWIEDNQTWLFDPPSEFSWNDHSTALRTINWLYFLKEWQSSGLLTPDKEQRMLRSLFAHGRLLAQEEFYTPNHNHGVDQDRALLALGITCPETPQSTAWMKVAERRLREQIAFGVSPDGVHLEHSPAYHLYGLHQLRSLASFLGQVGAKRELASYLLERTDSMAAYVPWLVKPDGYLVQVGDTGQKHITDYRVLLESFEGVPGLVDLASLGTTERFMNSAVIFADEGYAIIRDFRGVESFEKSFYLFLTAGANENRGHRQSDDLSFVLSAAGHDLVVDPGVYSYKRDAARAYVVSTAAHNSVVVDGASYDGWDTRIEGFNSSDRYTLISASHRNYAGIEHRRWLLYIRPDILFVVDNLKPKIAGSKPEPADRTRAFEQIFHFPPGSRVEVAGNQPVVRLYAGVEARQPALRVTQLGAALPDLRIYEGETTPMQGWYSGTWGEIVPAPALGSTIQGESAEFVTALEIVGTEPDAGVAARAFNASIENGMLSVQWAEGNARQTVRVDLQSNEVLLSAPAALAE